MKVTIVLNLSKTSDIELGYDAADYTLAITASSNFKAPSITAAAANNIAEQVTQTNTAIATLRNAIAASESITRTDNIKVARSVLDTLLTALAKSIETVANGVNVPDANRIAIVHSAGMDEKNSAVRQKQVFRVLPGEAPGSVALLAAGIKRGSHEWRYSTDLTGHGTWLPIDASLQAATIVGSLASGQEYLFQHRTIEKDGPTPWEAAIAARAK